MRWSAGEVNPWKRWFAWYPVRIGGEMIWLERIQRRFACDSYEVRLICCEQMRGEMWIDGERRPEWCPVHAPAFDGEEA